MKLTIIRLQHFSDQDRIDLGKIWPSQDPAALMLDENHRIYAARLTNVCSAPYALPCAASKASSAICACVKSPAAVAWGNI